MRILVVTQHFWPENFRINDIVEGFVQDGLSVDVLCGLPNYPKGEWFDGYSADGPFEEVYKGARVFRAREIRKGNTGKTIFLNYVSWPLYAAGALKRLPGGYDAVFCFNTSPVLMCWPAIRYAKSTIYRLRITSLTSGRRICTAYCRSKTGLCAGSRSRSATACTGAVTG